MDPSWEIQPAPPKKNAVLKLFQRTITYPTKQERRKIIDCKSAGDWMGYAILPTLRIPKDPWNGLNLYGVRGSSSQKMRGQAKAPTSSGEGHDLKCLSDRRNF